MYHRLWSAANILLIVISIVYIWFIRPHDSSLVVAGQVLAQVAVVLFFVNINMYFIFLVIRKTSVRKVKIRLAKFSRYFMKWHIKIALLGATVIIGHGLINFYELGPLLGYGHMKLWSGYLSILLLGITLFAGYLRHKKASGLRRKFHLISAMTFLSAFLLHMFVII
ncbi:hypothetical protein BABA_14702 [Neobacillus bataviensis LMG 21833]|uniref:Ferric oxidoreductase domain-containing protein n=1 Tax=Neobacillus bataviensis LMG 21833 TaxID=1117379 RepID=K6E0M7_9BACI|nr:hypothetical protein [Neobacillus bataviensis]EKN66716.1 hypothetical protein BABA_14702 [Neobacillus bataviensis LMG 21833]